jgi:hypothetical protein
MRRSLRSILREARLPKDERRAARMERRVEDQMRRERDNPMVAERIAARNAAEARRHSNQPWGQ